MVFRDWNLQKEASKSQTLLQYQIKPQQQTSHQTRLTKSQMNWAGGWGYSGSAVSGMAIG